MHSHRLVRFAQDLLGHVRGRGVRHHRRAHDRAPGARHREQLLHVLLAHAGAREAPEAAAPRAARRGAASEGGRPGRGPEGRGRVTRERQNGHRRRRDGRRDRLRHKTRALQYALYWAVRFSTHPILSPRLPTRTLSSSFAHTYNFASLLSVMYSYYWIVMMMLEF